MQIIDKTEMKRQDQLPVVWSRSQEEDKEDEEFIFNP